MIDTKRLWVGLSTLISGCLILGYSWRFFESEYPLYPNAQFYPQTIFPGDSVICTLSYKWRGSAQVEPLRISLDGQLIDWTSEFSVANVEPHSYGVEKIDAINGMRLGYGTEQSDGGSWVEFKVLDDSRLEGKELGFRVYAPPDLSGVRHFRVSPQKSRHRDESVSYWMMLFSCVVMSVGLTLLATANEPAPSQGASSGWLTPRA